MKIFAIIPAFNEEKQITNVVHYVQNYVDKVIVIDDGSSDKTYELANKAGAIVLKHLINRGQGASLETGNKYALSQGADIIVHFDADGQHRAEDIKKILQPIKNNQAEIVFGSRFLGNTINMPMSKKIILKIAILINNFISDIKLTDAHNGIRAMTSQVAKKMEITQDRMAHNTEINMFTSKNKLKYTEVPVTIVYQKYGQGFSQGLKILKELLLGRFI